MRDASGFFHLSHILIRNFFFLTVMPLMRGLRSTNALVNTMNDETHGLMPFEGALIFIPMPDRFEGENFVRLQLCLAKQPHGRACNEDKLR